MNKFKMGLIKNTEDTFFQTSLIILFSMPITFILSFIGLVFNVNVGSINFPLGFILAIILLKVINKSSSVIIPSILSIIFIGAALFYIAKTYDVSWDGQWYHQDAIIKLTQGWNPVYSHSNPSIIISDSDLWIHHYPQASWIVKAGIFKLTGSIQSSKAITILLSFSCLILAYTILKKVFNFNSIASIIFSIGIALNPVTYSQFFSFYVDGESAMMLSIYLLLIVYNLKHPSKLIYVALLLVFIYTVNIKFTNLVYLTIFNLFYFIWLYFNAKEIRLKVFKLFTVGYILGVFVLGYSSYTRNILEKGHPLYPIMGKDNYGDLVANIHASANFTGKNRFQNLISSSFAYPVYSRSPDSSKFRKPFTEVNYDKFYRTDSEMSGFGARWSEILIFTTLLFLISLFYFKNTQFKYYLLSIGIVLLSVFINEQCYMARYVPQLWLIPLIISIYLYTKGNIIFKLMSLSFSVFLIYNTSKIIHRQVLYQEEVNYNIKAEIEYFKGFEKPIEVKCKYLSIINRLKENNVPFNYLKGESDHKHYEFFYGFEENYYILP